MTVDFFSGIQPSGIPHLGNYFGAILPHIELAKAGKRCLYFIADLHSLTVSPKPEDLRKQIAGVAATYMALGLPEDTPLFKQSDVPDVGALSFILACNLGFGHLERMHAFKDKVAKGFTPNAGLAFYPVLMAADILMYNPKFVPTGSDQDQHLQLTQQAARSFNDTYGETFVIPQGMHSETPKVPGTDGQKMSKSYGNQIDIFASGSDLKKQLKKIITDSRPVEESKSPDFPLAEILYLFLTDAEKQEMTTQLAAGKVGYGVLKALLSEKIDARFGLAREQFRFLTEAEQGKLAVTERLQRGREYAQAIAQNTMKQVLERTGCR